MHSPTPRTAQRTFGPAAASVAAARRFVSECLEQWDLGTSVWTAQLLLSELATNAVLHAGGSGYTVGVEVLPDGSVRLTLADESPRPPRLRQYGTSATTGRGVALVDELARGWGVEPRPGGKVVWCEIDAEPSRLHLVRGEDEPGDGPPDLDAFRDPGDDDADGRASHDVRTAA